jgi:hypothetical protein
MEEAMRGQDWVQLLKAQAASSQTVERFCAARGVSKSRFYAERAKRQGKALVPIVVDDAEVRIKLELRTPILMSGKASDLAEVLRCL